MTVLSLIASLCSISVGGMSMDTKKIDQAQLSCQQYYVTCAKEKDKSPLVSKDDIIPECILERKI